MFGGGDNWIEIGGRRHKRDVTNDEESNVFDVRQERTQIESRSKIELRELIGIGKGRVCYNP